MTEESKDIVIKETQQIVSTLPTGEEAQNIIQWANMMADTKYYQTMVSNGGQNAIVAVFLASRELGIPPMQALNGGLYIVQGRVQLSSQMMNLMIRRKGHSIKKKIGNNEVCHLVGTRVDNGDSMESIFTMEMATKAGLTKNPVWKSHPARMLFNRALSNLAKDLFADCIGNALVEGEMESIDVTPTEPESLDPEAMKFINDMNLLDLECPASKFIDSISINVGQSRQDTISQCSKEPAKFKKNLEKFIEKTQPKEGKDD